MRVASFVAAAAPVAAFTIALALPGCRARPGPGAEDAGAGPTVLVRTEPLVRGPIVERVVAYGTVVAAPGASHTVSRPFETRIRKVAVSPGQRVASGDRLLELEPSPDTRLQVDDARAARAAAKQALESARQRLELGLATRADVVAAEETFSRAEARQSSLLRRGASGGEWTKASAAGVVGKVHVEPGQLVPAGGPLLEVLSDDGVEARLGIELEDLGRLGAGMRVALSPLYRFAAPEGSGRVRVLSRAVDPSTRLVDAMVSLDSPESYLRGEPVRASLDVAAREALLAPRAAVLPDGSAHAVYTVEEGVAHRHRVEIGLESASQVELLGGGLREGQQVVVLGNYELADGVAVREQAP